MNQAVTLYRLQQVDSLIDQYQRRINEIEKILADDHEVKSAEQETGEKDTVLHEARRVLKHTEADTQAQRIKIEFNHAQLFGGAVKNPKVLQDLQHESEALKRYLSVLEDRQLEAMLAAEDADAEHKASASKLDEARVKAIESHAALNGEKSALLKSVESQQDERRNIATGIPAEQLAQYEKLRVSRKGVAVAKVSDQACSACGSSLSSALLQAARSPSQLTKCDTCGRILYSV